MKTRFTLLLSLLVVFQVALAEVHITEADPANWSTQIFSPYIGQTVVFDIPIVVSTVSGTTLTVGPWRRFEPENQGEAGSEEYVQTNHINSNLLKLTNAPSGHRTGEHIYHLTAKVVSKSELQWQSGSFVGNSKTELQNMNIRRAVGINDDCDSCLVVCGFNLENYFVTHLGSQYLGADTKAEHEKQRAKTIATLTKINADIYGFCELEQGDAAIAEIASDLNKKFPNREYKYFATKSSGTNQKSDFLYDAKKVEPAGPRVGTNIEVSDRKKMVCFRHIKTGEKFIYSINHFKAMTDANSGPRREKEARAVVELYNSYRKKKSVRDNDVLFMGDLNSYAKASPILIFEKNNMIDLHRAFHADSSYSYVYGNMAAYIDHALCNETLFRQVTGMMAFHINSDEPRSNSYKNGGDNTMFRSSDHDPVIVGLRLDSTLSQVFDPYVSDIDFSNDSIMFYYISATGEPKMRFDIYTIDGHQIVPPTNIEFEGEVVEAHSYYYSLSQSNPNLPKKLKEFLPLPSGMYVIHFYYDGTVKAHKLLVR